jgi:hypothetical protein
MRRALPLVLLISALVAARASAQSPPPAAGSRSATQRFFAGLALNATQLDAPRLNPEAENGVGATILAGYAFSDRVSAIGGLTASNMNGNDGSYSLLHLDIGARYHFANPAKPLVPFIDVTMARRSATRTDIILTDGDTTYGGQLKMSGVGFTVGGGFNYFVRPKVAVSVGMNWADGEFTDLAFGGTETPELHASGATRRFNIGLVWFFPRG